SERVRAGVGTARAADCRVRTTTATIIAGTGEGVLMFVVHSYPLAVMLCVVTMFCWGSWANTRKLARKDWRFELFYWDYALGVLLLTLLLGLTLGSSGTEGLSFGADLSQASRSSIISALIGGAIFNLANILLVAAIEIAGMSVAFPVGIGLA